jgi:membrane-associated phospholipid phosphatase
MSVAALLGLAALAAAFVVIALLVREGGPLVVLDGRVQAGLVPLRRRPVLLAFDWLTQVGTGAAGAMGLLVATGLLWSDGRTGPIGPMWLCFVGAEATTWSLKFITARSRPPFLEGLTAASPSFPSAHATVAVSAYGFLTLAVATGTQDRMAGEVLAAGAILVTLIAFSRLVLSLHYLTDVVGGALVGAFWLLLAWELVP